MATIVSGAPTRINGTVTPTAAEDEELYTHLLRLQDVVLAGKHPQFKLPPDAVAQLKAALISPEIAANSAAHATNHASSTAVAKINGLPGLGAGTALDPIFLQKSDSLVRAENRLKRQRLEHDLQTQADHRRHTRVGREAENEILSSIPVDEVLRAAQERIKPVSGLKPAKPTSMSSFDENDYYSSRAPSDWSSEASSSKGSDRGAGAFTASFERLDGARPAFAESSRNAQKRNVPVTTLSKGHGAVPQPYLNGAEDVYDPEDEDDEYTPPDAATFDHTIQDMDAMDAQQDGLDDDNSDYEPGEITQENAPPTHYQPQQPSPRVIRNHLTHIAAPQPNRVSPLATAKGQSMELELVNGRPEVVNKPKPQQRSVQTRPMPRSRVSTASPPGFVSGRNKKRNKKRKREPEPNNRAKKRRDREVAHSPVSPAQREPYIKDEPVSPPPFASASAAPPYIQPVYRAQPPQVDLVSPRAEAQPVYSNEPRLSSLRYEYAQPASPALVRLASPGAYRPVPRDTQDLRRVASMHYAQRPASPAERIYSPVGPYRAASMSYAAEPQPVQYAPQVARPQSVVYQEVPAEPRMQYVRADRAPSPPRIQEYQDPYARAQSPAIMAPPPPRRIVVDQYGNRYYAADPAPVSARASVAPVDRQPEAQPVYEGAPSRMSVAYAPAPASAPRYEPVDARMAPPPPRRQDQPVEYVDASGYRVREYSARPVEAPRYTQAPTSPVYEQAPRYEPMLPPAPPAAAERTSPVYQAMPRYEAIPPPPAPQTREQTSPVYQEMPRAYSVRPQEAPQSAMSYVRQASVAPVQYARQDMPPPPPPSHRAVSVAPGVEYRAQTQQPVYSYAPVPQPVRYVDQYGREVDPQQMRQASIARY